VRLIVTGGAGFIGSNVVRAAITRGHSVLNIDALTYAGDLRAVESVAAQPTYQFAQADIADAARMRDLIEDYAPDAILNLAAESHVDRSIDDPGAFIRTNVVGTYTLLDAAYRYWAAMAEPAKGAFRFIQISTDEVYGSLGRDGHFVETTPYAPNSPYSASKASGDHLARAWHATYGLPVLVTNCSNNYGPFQHPEKLIPTIIRNALDGTAIPIYGDGQNRRDWLHVDDHVAGLFAALERGVPGESYNFGGRAEVANLDMAHTS
jgi:dTDP-glucose 4,6-dehydratase